MDTNSSIISSNRVYIWKCDGCRNVISSDSPCPKEFEVASFTEDYSCKKCKSGMIMRLITQEEYINMNRQPIENKTYANYKISNIDDIISLINEGDPIMIETIVNGLTIETKKSLLQRLQLEKL